MDETVLIAFIVGLVISLIISYYIIKYAVMDALHRHTERNNNKNIERKLEDIFIQLGGDPNAFLKAEVEANEALEEKLKQIRISVKGVNPIWKEIDKAKNQSKIDIIEMKREIVKNRL